MRLSSHALLLLTAMSLCLASAQGYAEDDDDDDGKRRGDRGSVRHRDGEYKEKYQDGPCKIERESKKDGAFKEERECKGIFSGPYYRGGGEYEEKFEEGGCKVEREWKKDGTYKEKIDCKDHHRRVDRGRREPVRADSPPWIVLEPSGPVYRQGWEPPPGPASSGGMFHCNRAAVGAAIGGVAGGAIGSRVGTGDGRMVATVGGAIVGALIGGAIGRQMDSQDQACIGHALEFAEPGRHVSWEDRAAGRQYVVVPGAIRQRSDGRYCRPYETRITGAGKRETVSGTACRRADGSWVKAD